MKLVFRILALLFFLILELEAFSQCAMCKATAESNANGGGSEAAGLNSGILYLMFIPYLLIAGIAIAIYRHKRKLERAKGA